MRLNGTPVQYLTRRSAFYGREFYVDERVLIPRFDTECVVESVLSVLPESAAVLDLCCGSGCIGVSVGAERKDVKITFADKSEDALDVTKINAGKYGVQGEYVCCDIFEGSPSGIFDVIVSNPPYISAGEMQALDPEVKKEPVCALFGGEDGLDFYRQIPVICKPHIRSGGYLIFECGAGQTAQVADLCQREGYADITVKKDLGGIQRCVIARNLMKE